MKTKGQAGSGPCPVLSRGKAPGLDPSPRALSMADPVGRAGVTVGLGGFIVSEKLAQETLILPWCVYFIK